MPLLSFLDAQLLAEDPAARRLQIGSMLLGQIQQLTRDILRCMVKPGSIQVPDLQWRCARLYASMVVKYLHHHGHGAVVLPVEVTDEFAEVLAAAELLRLSHTSSSSDDDSAQQLEALQLLGLQDVTCVQMAQAAGCSR